MPQMRSADDQGAGRCIVGLNRKCVEDKDLQLEVVFATDRLET